MEGAVMIRADSFLLHEKSKTPPEKGGVFTSLDELRRIRTLTQLKKYTSRHPAVIALPTGIGVAEPARKSPGDVRHPPSAIRGCLRRGENSPGRLYARPADTRRCTVMALPG
jgi:hypothetical protein